MDVNQSDEAQRMPQVLTMTASEFEADCGAILGQLVEGSVKRVDIVKSGKVVAIMAAPQSREDEIRAWLGSMRDMTFISPDTDLTEPILQDIPDAELGILHQ